MSVGPSSQGKRHLGKGRTKLWSEILNEGDRLQNLGVNLDKLGLKNNSVEDGLIWSITGTCEHG